MWLFVQAVRLLIVLCLVAVPSGPDQNVAVHAVCTGGEVTHHVVPSGSA